MRREEEIVRSIIKSWGEGVQRMKDTWTEHCHEDIVWWNSARGELRGMEANLAVFDKLEGTVGYSSLRSIPRAVLADEGIVMVERAEDLLDADGNSIVHIPVMGVVLFEGDKIVEWRDYCIDWYAKFRAENETANIAETV